MSFPSLSLLEETVDSAFGTWAVPNGKQKSLCTFMLNSFLSFIIVHSDTKGERNERERKV